MWVGRGHRRPGGGKAPLRVYTSGALQERRNQVTMNVNEFEGFIKRQGVSVPSSKKGSSKAWSWRLGQTAGNHRGYNNLGIYSNYSGKYWAIHANDCRKNSV